ncbi:hypothetical protein D9756_004908 [Leucocoprinus leucothites]|uniref:dolichyl-P-Glc:Man9GlcNAc2-PP-dolichol alpha-1,3-glucosyltransferase n=1 Tax=Leucocoprinus leucothites TaxID=201217 RepID=A0A8H5LKR4_9AGAR|nr:hypothetical protein D9756_004908 [Leucoagaricus leucothites]
MDVHTSLPTSSKRQRRPSGSGFSNSQRLRTTSLNYMNPRSVYSNPSPATSRADSPTALLGSTGAGLSATGGYTGPYRMIPGKSKSSSSQQQPQPQKKIDILAPVPRRHLIDNSASSFWLTGQEETEKEAEPSEYQPFPQPTSYSRGNSLPPESPLISPISPSSTLHSVHHQHSPARARSPSFFREPNSVNFSVPTTAPAGTTRFFGQQELGVSSSLASNPSAQGGPTPHRRITSQSFSTLHQNQQHQSKEREGGLGLPSGARSSSLTHPRQHLRVNVHPRHGQEAVRVDDGMGKVWIRWMHKRGIKAWTLPLLVLLSTLLKFCIGLGPYSGHGTPPLFGDYEAQRHWMELTLHLPFRRWYKYDLQYWGLDYPPLTAYVSWICGVAAHWINPTWVALDKSRGIETEASKVFMRATVVVWDILVYVPALVMFVKIWQGNRSGRTQELALLMLLFQPALLLIDFGHFQYNSVMLGFTLLAMNFFATGHDLIGAVFFVLSLGFKQMALYYAPAIGSYLLAKCLYLGVPGPGLKHFTRLGVTTILSLLLLFLPFYFPPFAPSIKSIMDPIMRIFPFNRGLFEDKVANFWCASNIVLKWRERLGRNVLMKLSTGLTALGFLSSVGSMLNAGWKVRLPLSKSNPSGVDSGEDQDTETQAPFLPLLPYALLTSSFSFFLFSFQVHEKTILVPLLPMTLLLSGAPVDSSAFAWGVLVNNIGVFSMWPLLKKDGLSLQYFTLLLLWNKLIGYNPLRLPSGTLVQLLSLGAYAAAVTLHLFEMIVNPPARYPDIYPVLNVLISTPVFALAWLWSIKCGFQVGWAVGGLGSSSTSTSSASKGTKASSLAPEEASATSSSNTAWESVQGSRQGGQRAMSLGLQHVQAGTGSRRRKSGVSSKGDDGSLKSRTSDSTIL